MLRERTSMFAYTILLVLLLIIAYILYKFCKSVKADLDLEAKWASAKHVTVFNPDKKSRLSQKQNITFDKYPMETYWWDNEDECWTDIDGKELDWSHNYRAKKAINRYVNEVNSKSIENLRKKAQW